MIYKFSQIIYSQRPHLTSYHVNGVTVTDVDHCLLECQRTQSCSWFTFHPDNNFCEMFTGCIHLDVFSCPGKLW